MTNSDARQNAPHRSPAEIDAEVERIDWRLRNLSSLQDVAADAIVALARASGASDGDFAARFLLALEDQRQASSARDGVAYKQTMDRIREGVLPERG
jgi:hypothetical protein